MAVGFGLASFRMVGMGIDFKGLDTQQALVSFRQTSHRAILLDWGGTLTPGIHAPSPRCCAYPLHKHTPPLHAAVPTLL